MFDSYEEAETQEYTPDPDRVNFYPQNLAGHNIILWVNAHIKNAPGGMKEDSDAIDVTVVDLDRPSLDNSHWGRVCNNIWWRAGSLISKLKGRVGRAPIVVHLSTGEPAQRGWRPPFALTDVSRDPQVAAKAQAWVQWNPAFVPDLRAQEPYGAVPSPPSAAPQPPPVPQPPRTPPPPAQSSPTLAGTPTLAGPPHPPAPVTVLDDPWEADRFPPRPQGVATAAPLPPVPAGVPAPQMSPSVQPTLPALPPPAPSPQEVTERLARAHAQNATLDSLRKQHNIPGPSEGVENPPF